MHFERGRSYFPIRRATDARPIRGILSVGAAGPGCFAYRAANGGDEVLNAVAIYIELT